MRSALERVSFREEVVPSDDEIRFDAEDAALLHRSLATLDLRHREVLVLHGRRA
jgi:hypothetical protein